MTHSRSSRHRAGLTARLLLLAALLSSPSALAQEAPSSPSKGPSIPRDAELERARREVGSLLTAHHALPSKEALLAASPRAQEALTSLLQDASLFPLYRQRAASLLATHFPDDATRAALTALSSKENPLRDHALYCLAIGFPAHSLPLLEAALMQREDADLRLGAAVALTYHPSTEQARALLAHAARTLDDPRLVPFIERHLAK